MRLSVRGFLLTAIVAALVAPAAAQTLPSPVLATPAAWTRFALPNGLVVLVAERPGIPIVIVHASVEAGAILDPEPKLGVANLTAELLTRGSAAKSALEIDSAIEFVGGSLEGDG
jgi:zinc protease